jgi:hypothetical protein
MSERALAATRGAAERLLALLSVPTSAFERLASGVVAVSTDAGERFIAARAQVSGKETLVFMLPEEFYAAGAASPPELLAVVLDGVDRVPVVIGPELV